MAVELAVGGGAKEGIHGDGVACRGAALGVPVGGLVPRLGGEWLD